MADYTLQELSDAATVTPRTVRYYVAQGLLPSPGAGSGARYTDTHLQRLRLIKQLQRNHLPLAEIRARLAQGSALDYVQRVLGRSTGAPAPESQSGPMFALPVAPAAAWPPTPPAARAARMPASSPPPAQPDRSQWDRVALSPDVELHIRRPLTRDQNRRVDRLIAVARQLLQEDQP